MSTEQEDAAMLLGLEQKITHRIREQILGAFAGVDYDIGSTTNPLTSSTLKLQMQNTLINDPYFITEIARKIGGKLTNVNY